MQKQWGRIELIFGCMYSGKTEELLKQMHRAKYAKKRFQLFKPIIDDRYSATAVTSHNQNSLDGVPVHEVWQILSLVEASTDIVGIDEAQFFTDDIIDVVNTLSKVGKTVWVAGLDTDWKAQPFGPMPKLMAIADRLHKQYAICQVCGDLATRTQRLVASTEDVLVGANNMYEARCRVHFDPELSVRLIKSQQSVTVSAPEASQQMME